MIINVVYVLILTEVINFPNHNQKYKLYINYLNRVRYNSSLQRGAIKLNINNDKLIKSSLYIFTLSILYINFECFELICGIVLLFSGIYV